MISSTQTNDSEIIEIVHLHPNEMQLIRAIRNQWRFGDITIKVRDGLPFRMLRVQEFVDLGGKES